VRREAERDNAVLLTLLHKGERYIRVMPVKDKEVV